MTDLIRVLIVDDHPLVREGLQAVFAEEPDIEIVGEASDGMGAIRQARDLQPDVTVMDLLMPGMSGGEAISAIIEADPAHKILVLTSTDNISTVLAAVRAGALGYVSKNAPPEDLLQAIRLLDRGSLLLPAPIAQALLTGGAVADTAHPADRLTDRETEVLRLVAHGLNNDDIGRQLCISPRTASVHISRILTKLGLGNRTQAALYALRNGLVELQ